MTERAPAVLIGWDAAELGVIEQLCVDGRLPALQSLRARITDANLLFKVRAASNEVKDREKRARWLNVILPVFFIWLVGAVISVLRAAGRSAAPRIPPPVPPASLAEGGTDS